MRFSFTLTAFHVAGGTTARRCPQRRAGGKGRCLGGSALPHDGVEVLAVIEVEKRLPRLVPCDPRPSLPMVGTVGQCCQLRLAEAKGEATMSMWRRWRLAQSVGDGAQLLCELQVLLSVAHGCAPSAADGRVDD